MNDRGDINAIRYALNNPRDVATRLGLKGKVEGSGVKILCPSHGERTPSCSLTRGADGTLRVKCFSCDLSGDIFSLVAAVENLDLASDFGAVLSVAANHAGVTLSGRDDAPREPRRLPPPAPVPSGPPPLDDALFDELVRPLLWTGRLDDSPIAADVTAYLRSRGLLELAQAEGWAALPVVACQRTWIQSLRDVHGDDVVARSGLVYAPENGEPDFRAFVHGEARLIIPWRNANGIVTTLQRRRLDAGKPKYVFASGRQPKDPYGVHRLADASPGAAVGYCEGGIDALALRELRRRDGVEVVALGIPGVSAWSRERAPRWSALASGRLAAVALDADKAGAQKVDGMLSDLLTGGAVDLQTWTPERAKDWADVLLNDEKTRRA